jgi:hypothetical protein
MLTALRGAHVRSWAVIDLRLPNIIFAHDVDSNSNRFFLIDTAEFAQEFGQPIDAAHVARAPAGWPGAPNTANAKWDLLMLASLFSGGWAATIDADPQGRLFRRLLASGDTVAGTLLTHPFLSGLMP